MRRIFLVGPSCAGKTSCYNYLKARFPELNFPPRLITRPPRHADDMAENRFVSPEEFLRLQQEQAFFLSWERPMDGGRVERYGFLRADVESEKTTIFSCNNALVLNRDSIRPAGVCDGSGSQIIYISAPFELRQQRIAERSPELSEAEVVHRLYREELPPEVRPALTIENSRGLSVTGERLALLLNL